MSTDCFFSRLPPLEKVSKETFEEATGRRRLSMVVWLTQSRPTSEVVSIYYPRLAFAKSVC